jgi:hypothetical protein
LELDLSARHEFLIQARVQQARLRARALRSVAAERASRFAAKTSTNLSRIVFLGLIALALVLPRGSERERPDDESSFPNVEILRTHPVPAPVAAPAAPAAKPDVPADSSAAPDPTKPEADSRPVPPSKQKAPPWTPSEIEAAQSECARLLGNVVVDAEPLPAAREGICGAPAPRELKSLGQSKVKIDPPATLNCPMVAALNTWLTDKLQPQAQKSFGSPIVRILGESYSCRNRYGLARAPISEHALMDAIDVSAFVLADGKVIRVSKAWGPTRKEEAAARAKAAAAAVAVAVAVAAKSKPHIAVPAKLDASEAAQRSGAKSKPRTAEETAKKTASDFLHRVHDDACEIFGTVLGPDTNDAHHDHFHLDMKARKRNSICE